jgi:hypothetical protein
MIDIQGLIDEFEAAWEEEEQAEHLKAQAKEVLEGVKDRLNAYASDVSMKKTIIKEAYSRFRKHKKHRIDLSDDAQEAIVAIDEYFAEQEEAPSDNTKSD